MFKMLKQIRPLTTREKIFLLLMIFLNTFDAGATSVLITTGLGYEANPLMAFLLDQGIVWFLLFKVLIINYVIYAVVKMTAVSKVAKYGFWIIFTAYTLLFFYYAYWFIFSFNGVI